LKHELRNNGKERIRNVTWLKQPSPSNASLDTVITYGNEASLGYIYRNYVILFGSFKHTLDSDGNEEENNDDSD
jgi:hypothetical protein